MKNERQWFVRIRKEYDDTAERIEEKRIRWENAAGHITKVEEEDGILYFVFDKSKKLK